MFNYKDYKVFLACGSTDMRKNINGLCEIVQHNFELDPSEKRRGGFCKRKQKRRKGGGGEEKGGGGKFKRGEKGRKRGGESEKEERRRKRTVEAFAILIKAPGVKQKIKR